MKYMFEIQPHTVQSLQAQVSSALEKRTELLSRKQYASLWKTTDRLNSRPKRKSAVGKADKIWAIIKLLLAGFLLLTAVLAKAQGRSVSGVAFFVLAGILGTSILTLSEDPLRRRAQKRFDRAAAMLLEKLADIQPGQVCIAIDENGMEMREGVSVEMVSYAQFECIVEEEELFLVTFDGKAMVLPKSDLAEGSAEDLRKVFQKAVFLNEKILHDLQA